MAALATDSVIAVIGGGAMGTGIAQIAAAAGYPVRVYDNRAGVAAQAVTSIVIQYRRLVEKGRMTSAAADAASARLRAVQQLSELADASLVVEAIIEDLAIKRALFAELEALVSKSCILASNTSSISVTAIGADLRHPERLLGMHFFNPVPLMGLVEVISGLATGTKVASTVFDTALSWGKAPVHARSTPGFIVNRIARPYYAEGLRLLNEQAADPTTLDAVMREAGGFRMGPFELMDLIGHDVNLAVTRSVFNSSYQDPRFTPSVIQQELVDAGFLGRKTGRGFYSYVVGAPMPQPRTELVQHAATVVSVSTTPLPAGLAMLRNSLVERFRSHGIAVTETLQGGAPTFQCGGAAIHLSDGRSATQRASDDAYADTVLYDLALDYSKATRIALSRAEQCSVDAWQDAVALFQCAGFSVSRLDDVAGMAVMRTVGMLANEAADTVYQGVCSPADADLAMRSGVNYPRGPLAWADAVGIAHIVTVLDHMLALYGEDRYRVSPLLRRKSVNGAQFFDCAR